MDNLENLDDLKEKMKIHPEDPGPLQQFKDAKEKVVDMKDKIADLKDGGLKEMIAEKKEALADRKEAIDSGIHEKLDWIKSKLMGIKETASEKVLSAKEKFKGQFASDPINELLDYVDALPNDLNLELKTAKTHLIIKHTATTLEK